MTVYATENIRNVAVVGHSDTGKTSLVSALLFDSGAVNRLCKVDDGNTITDFDDDEIERNDDTVQNYSRLVADRARSADLLPLAESGIRHVIEQAARQAEDSERLSMHIRSLDHLLIQADHWARQRGAESGPGNGVPCP